MKYIIIALISIMTLYSSLFSQNVIDNVLIEIEKNNTTLSALKLRVDADKVGNKTGIYIQNPEFEFNYLWGNPSLVGNRLDINLKQTFDYPTAYKFRNQISSIKNIQVEFEYQKQLKELLLESRLICYDLVYINALKSELSKRLVHAQNIASSTEAKLNAGETNILDYNKAQLNLFNLNSEMEMLEIDREALLGELTRLNGGKLIDFVESEYQETTIPADFEQWYMQAEQNSPLLNWLKKEIEINEQQLHLDKAMNLPKIQAGYMLEKVVGQEFQGVTLGLSIPLWENKNKYKYTVANKLALEKSIMDNKIQLFNHLKNLHTKATGLQDNSSNYKIKLQTFDNTELLKKALDKGEITLIDYILELSIYYESVNNLLILDRDMNKTIAELNQYL